MRKNVTSNATVEVHWYLSPSGNGRKKGTHYSETLNTISQASVFSSVSYSYKTNVPFSHLIVIFVRDM